MIQDGDKATLAIGVEVYRVGEMVNDELWPTMPKGTPIALVYTPEINYTLRVPLKNLVPA